MKGVLEIEAKVLRAALADVAGAVEARNTIPILSNVLLSVGRHRLSIEATDLDIWVQRHVAVEAADAFTFTAEASTLRRVVDKLPAGAMCTLQVADGALTIKAGRSKFTLPTLPADDFPSVSAKDWTAEFEIPALTFGAAIGRVASAASTEETRYYLNGVYLEAREAELIAVATDGHRLSRTRLPLPDGAETLKGSILPRKVVKLLDPLLGRHEGSIDVRVCASRIRFEIGETTIDAKLIDGTFPDYTRVIPTHHDRRLSIEREALVAALGRVITVSSDKQRVVKAELDRDRLVLSVSSPEKGQGSEELPCDYTDKPLTIGFNTRFLLDALSEIDGDVIEGLFTDAAGPALWRLDDRAASTFVIMPLRV